MEWLSVITSHASSRWALAPAEAALVYGFFSFLDVHLSSDARGRLSEFLRGARYETYLGLMPSVVQKTFTWMFGERHLSKRCISMSILLSVLSVALTFLFTFVYNPEQLTKGIPALGDAVASTLDKMAKLDTTKDFAQTIIGITASLGTWGLLATGLVVWLLWCVIPDYLALLKSRIVILVMCNSGPRVGALITTVVVDFIVGTWVFITSLVVPQTVAILLYVKFHGSSTLKLASGTEILAAAMVFSAFLFGIEGAILAPTGAVWISVPFGNLFWASMVPSLWLWVYVFAAILTRALMASKSLLSWLIYFLDVKEHPLRSLGLVAAIVIGALQGLFLLALLAAERVGGA